MHSVLAEFIKLRRSLAWAVVVLLPVVMVASGSVMTLVDGRPLADGWHTLWLRSMVFYGLFPLAVGIAMLASLVWRVEHRGGMWNALMSGPTSSTRIVLGKVTVLAVMLTMMQLIAVACVVVLGKVAFGLPGMLPAQYLGISVLVVLTCVPVAVLQCGLSMMLRSFAAPVALALLGSGVSVVLMMIDVAGVGWVSPYAVLSRTTQLGTAAFADSGEVTGGLVGALALAALMLSGMLVTLVVAVLDRRDVRA